MKALRSTCLPLALALAVVSAREASGRPQDRWSLANTCGNETTPPQVFTTEAVSPLTLEPGGQAPPGFHPGSARLARAGVHYVAGTFIRVRVITDACTSIVGVRYGTRVLTTQSDGGFWYAALPPNPPPTDPGQSGHNVTIFFPQQGDGATEVVTVTVGRTGGTGTVDASFRLVRVSAVQAEEVSAPVGFSRAEVFNLFSKALAEKFGPNNSTVIVSASDGSQRRIYDYDPSSLIVNVTNNGIAFQFQFKTDIPAWCDPTVRAHGTFKLNAAPASGLSVDWVNFPQAGLNWPALCQAIQVVPILGLVPTLTFELLGVESQHVSGIMSTIEETVVKSFPTDGAGQLFLDGSSTRSNELLVNLKLSVPSITIQVPYDAFDQNRGATPFASGELLTLVASGLGMNDSVAGANPPAFLRSGPNGVPPAGTTSFPRPQAVARTGNLVWNTKPVGRLLARSQPALLQTRTIEYEPGCTIRTVADRFGGSPWIRFGVNDTAADAARLRANGASGYSVRVHFLNEATFSIREGAALCNQFTSGPVIAGAEQAFER